MKKILITIPSLNEAENISILTSKIDSAIIKYQKEYDLITEFFILNADSNSDDNTSTLFENTPTLTNKKTINTGRNGKGVNIIEACNFAINYNFDYLITIDGDIKSFEYLWISKFVLHLLDGYEFIFPLYKRNRYEGNTTNHLCYPLLKILLNQEIRQPIAGDFAFTKEIAKHFVNNFEKSHSGNYGIDIFMTLTALKYASRICSIELNEKLHKPSFGKMVKMFEEVADSMFYYLNKYKIITNNPLVLSNSNVISILTNSEPISSDKIKLREIEALNLISSSTEIVELSKYYIVATKLKFIDKNTWLEILDVITNVVYKYDASILAKAILPLYLFRVLGYFKEIDNLNSEEIEQLIKI